MPHAGANQMHALTHAHNVPLVLLSVLVAVAGSYAALQLAGQVALATGRVRAWWLLGATLALGVGVWAMHFVGMLALELPVPVAWDPAGVLVSLAVSLAGSGAGLAVATRRLPIGGPALAAAGLFVGFAIVGMHFAGMAAMRVTAVPEYRPVPVALSAAVAVALSTAGLWTALRAGNPSGAFAGEAVRRGGGALLLGGAIVGMHYLAMAGTIFISAGGPPASRAVLSSGNGALAWGVGAGALTVFALALVGSAYGRRLSATLAEARALKEIDGRSRALAEGAPDFTSILEADGTVRYVTPSVERVLGYRPEERTGRSAFELVHPDDAEAARRALQERVAGDMPRRRLEHRYRHKNGSWRYLETVGNNLLSDPGVRGIVVTSRDVTERREAEVRLREAEARYRALVENIPAVVYVDDADETNSVIYRSPYVRQVLGYEPEEFFSHPTFWQSLLHPDDRERVLAENERTNETGEPFRIEYRMVRKDGSVVWLRDEAFLVRDEEGNPRFWQGYFADISYRKQAEARLAEAETRYRTLVEQLPVAVYRQEIEHGGATSYVSPEIGRITGYTAEEWVADPGLWARTLHPEDRERALAEDERTDRTQEPFEVEHRMLRKDGRLVWVRNEAVLIRDGEGRPLYWQGIVSDVTERKEAEEALKASGERLRALVHNASDLIAILDASGDALYLSPSFREVQDLDPAERVGKNAFAYVHPDDRAAAREAYAALLREGGKAATLEFRLRGRGGSWRHLEAVGRNLLGNPAVGGVVVNARDVTERKELEERLRHRATHDPLTGLPNRALLAERLDQALSRAKRRGSELSLLYIDLDDFKDVNDALGHPAGDRVLAAAAHRLKGAVRPEDTVVRMGGDEFVILLEDADRRRALSVAERVATTLGDPFSAGRERVTISASIGVAPGGPGTAGPEELLRNADRAMYLAKQAGKGRHAVVG